MKEKSMAIGKFNCTHCGMGVVGHKRDCPEIAGFGGYGFDMAKKDGDMSCVAVIKNSEILAITRKGISPEIVTAIDAFDDALVAAINVAQVAGVHKGMIVGLLFGHAHAQTSEMVESGYR
jgi:hypothetical protein